MTRISSQKARINVLCGDMHIAAIVVGCEQEALDEEKQDDRFLVKARTPTEPWGTPLPPGPTMQADEGNDLLHPTKVRIPRRAMRARYLGIDHGRG